MGTTVSGENIHRLIKLAVDTGDAATLEDARRLFSGYALAIEVGPDIARKATSQAALMTAVNAGRRCFLGGVTVSGPLDADLLIPWHGCHSLAEAVIDLQGKPADRPSPGIPRIVIGDAPAVDTGAFAVRATWEGWSGGVVPLDMGWRLNEGAEFTPAGVLAGAIAVGEAFQHVRGDNPVVGRRAAGLSLWRPDREVSWLTAEPGPRVTSLPARLWFIGLGHLGQACLWTLGFLPYVDPDHVDLTLQDTDALSEANDSTSSLTDQTLLGQKKTRAMAAWAERRGFRTTIVERRFADSFRVDDHEPRVAVCGIDNALGRAVLEDVGFDRVVEAGLGSGIHEYLAFQLHTFPGSQTAHHLWDRQSSADSEVEELLKRPAYQALAAAGMDGCGISQLAGRTVGAPFVGKATSALVIAELIRLAMGAHRYDAVDGSLLALAQRATVLAAPDAVPFKPGIARAMI